MFSSLYRKGKAFIRLLKFRNYDRVTTQTRWLFAEYWSYAVDRRQLWALTDRFFRYAEVQIADKIRRDLGEEVLRRFGHQLHGQWFEIWLAYAHHGRLRIRTTHLDFYNCLLATAETQLLRRQSWEEVVRNVPALVWLRLMQAGPDVFLHLARGMNIRRHPGFGQYSRKMAHIYHHCNDFDFSNHDGGVHAFLLSIGLGMDVSRQIRSLVHNSLSFPFRLKEMLRMAPLLLRLDKMLAQREFTDLQWGQLAGFIGESWRENHRKVLALKQRQQLLAAAKRHFDKKAEQADLADLLAQHEYTVDTRWEAGAVEEWNGRHEGCWYHLRELRSAAELLLEGAHMHHCVGDLVQECLEDECRIYSLRARGFRQTKWRSLATIEVIDGRIIQARAALNTSLDQYSKRWVEAWAQQAGLPLNWDELE